MNGMQLVSAICQDIEIQKKKKDFIQVISGLLKTSGEKLSFLADLV